jgi:hypothetical protein
MIPKKSEELDEELRAAEGGHAPLERSQGVQANRSIGWLGRARRPG